jgi:hypothetical protein
VEQAGKPVHKRIIDNAATSVVEQAGKPVHKRIIDNAATSHIVSGGIGIIKSSQQLTLNHSVFQPPVNSQQSTVNNHSGTTGIDVMFAQSAKIVISSKDAIATSAFSK